MSLYAPVLALLPFETAAAGSSDRYLAQGLAADVVAELERSSALTMIPWPSSAAAAGLPDRDIRDRLGATHVLRGEIEHADGRLAVTLRLSDAPTGVQVWEDHISAPDAETLAVRDRIVARIAFALAARHGVPPAQMEGTRARLAGLAAREEPIALQRPTAVAKQDIRFCKASDGVTVAYAVTGDGPPIIKAANWMSHLEYEWESPVWRHWIDALSDGHTLVRYDERGNGLSDWDAADLSFEAMVADLESVVEATGLKRFTLLGLSQGCAISVAYAVRHPERVCGMILYGGYVKGWKRRANPHEVAKRAALNTLIREGWGQDNPVFRQVFTSLFIPDASREQMNWWNDLQRITVSPENAARLSEAFGDIDVADHLPQVRVPTLVLHARHDLVCPIEGGRALAAGIPTARLVTLESANHILLEHEPAFARFLEEVRAFVDKVAEADTVCADSSAAHQPIEAKPAPADRPCALVHQGDSWLVDYDGQSAVLPDMKGLLDLQRLLSAPGEEVHCLDLAGRGGDSDGGDAVLDARAKRAYQQRLRDLQEELMEAEDGHDLARAERARSEMDALIEMLSHALGLGGRKRTLGNLTERARTTVTWRIRHAIRKIEAAHPSLGRHLGNSLRTGTFCSYRPEKPLAWRLTEARAAQTSRTSRIASPSA